jgi:preprotein translocase subunit SecE
MAKKHFIKNNALVNFIREAYKELIKVVWPKRREVIVKTIVVVLSMVIVAALIGALDYGLYALIKFLINIKQ